MTVRAKFTVIEVGDGKVKLEPAIEALRGYLAAACEVSA